MSPRELAAGDRVVVSVKNRSKWNEAHASAFEGLRGTVEEVKPGYEYPVALGGCTPVTGYLVAFDAPVVVHDPGRPVRAFHFLAEDLRLEAP